MDIQMIEARRHQVLESMRQIRSMRAGSVSEQYLKVRHKGKKEPVLRGPYFLWQFYEEGRPVRRRLSDPEEVARAQREVAQYKAFVELCREFAALTVQLGELERQEAAAAQALKKTPKLPSKRTRK